MDTLTTLLLAAPPEKTALIETADGRSFTSVSYGQLTEMVAATQERLSRLALLQGERIGVIGPNSADFIAAMLGTMACRLVAVPLNNRLPDKDLAAIALDAELAAVIGPADETARLPDVPLLPSSSAPALGGAPSEADKTADDDLALIMYTSGSTGKPKGVTITHKGYRWALETLKRHAAVFNSCLVSAPLFHMNGQAATFLYLAAGGTVVLMPRFSVRNAIAAIETFQPEEVSGVPSMVAMLAQNESISSRSFPLVKCLGLGSAPLTPALIEMSRKVFPQAMIDNGYGTTETGPVSFGSSEDGHPRPVGSLGFPIPGVEAVIEGGGDEGELLLRTPMTTPGYWRRPELTKKAVVDGFYRTSDIVRRDEHGCFYFVDRRDDAIICGGENVFPGAVERMLETHPDVAEAVVVGVDHVVKGRVPAAFVVAARGVQLSEQDLRDYALANGPAYAHPRHIWVVTELPVAGTHKIDRRRLTHQAGELASETSGSSNKA